MRKILPIILIFSLPGCDQYKFQGMRGAEVSAKVEALNMADGYRLYLESYKGTHPHMIDAAGFMRKYGDKGRAYLLDRAFKTNDELEFEADMMSMFISDFTCNKNDFQRLISKSKEIGSDAIFVYRACELR